MNKKTDRDRIEELEKQVKDLSEITQRLLNRLKLAAEREVRLIGGPIKAIGKPLGSEREPIIPIVDD